MGIKPIFMALIIPVISVMGVQAQKITFNKHIAPIIHANCTPCHSSKLVIQNRATREGWESIIRWMQETQNLWELGSNQPIILNYLVRNYAPEAAGRRANLKNIEWYELED